MNINTVTKTTTVICIATTIAHFASVQLYHNYCAPPTIMGFILTPIRATLPHCQGLTWTMNVTANSIRNTWLVAGSWICVKITAVLL